MAKKKVNKAEKVEAIEKKPVSAIPVEPSKQNQKWVFALALFIIGFLLYANTIQNGYILDDTAAIKTNKFVQQGISGIPDIMKVDFWYFENEKLGYYRPLSLITFALEIEFFGNNPHVSHFDNVLLFAFTGLFLFLLLMELFPSKNPFYAFLIGLIFICNPIHTEVVANIKSRDELLSFLNIVAMLYFALRYKQVSKTWQLILALVFFYLALLSKETAVVGIALLPLVLYFKGSDIKSLGKKILPYAGVAAFFFLQKYYLLSLQQGIMPTDSLSYPYVESAVKIPTTFYMFAFGLKQMVFPWPLSYDYSYNQIPGAHWGDAGALGGFLLFAGLAFMAFRGLQKRTIYGLGLSILFITIAPMLAFVFLRGGIMAERILYAPCLGYAMLLVYLLSLISKKTKEKNIPLWLKNNLTLVIPVLAISLVYGFETFGRNKDWKDELTLYSHDIKFAQKSARAHYSLGNTILETERGKKNTPGKKDSMATAEAELQTALDIYSQYPEAIMALANLYQDNGDYKKAIEYQSRLSQNESVSNDGQLDFNKGNALLGENDIHGAIAEFKKAIAANPGSAEAYVNLGTAYNDLGQYDSGIEVLNSAMKLKPNMPEIYINLGTCYYQTKKYKEGIANYNTALKLRPNYPEAFIGIGQTYMAVNADSALKYTRKGLALNPDYVVGQFNLGLIYIAKKDITDANESFKKTLQLKPGYLDAVRNLAWCATQLKDYNAAIEYDKQALALNPNIPDIYYSMEYAYVKMGNKALAEDCKKKGDALKGGAK